MSVYRFLLYALPCFPQKHFQLVHWKMCKKKFKIHFQTLRTFDFDFKVASKRISKILPLANFKMEPCWRLWFAFPETVSTSSLEKWQKKWKISHLNPQNNLFHLQVASKPFSKMLPTTSFGFNVWIYFLYFEDFDFLFRKMVLWCNFVFELKVASDLLSKIVPIPNLWLN